MEIKSFWVRVVERSLATLSIHLLTKNKHNQKHKTILAKPFAQHLWLF
ncbi:hypothetical protein AALB_1513 [Agarivorans albus MKT 106]|uniref:Uncharacterized protein n=1 Tax=Agarivorans albus MKT 106 TaxID=1331007 RepID=R9PJL4_AGAAL|nr:hypothetical protein AALB_1513 [Agarivorans albus MKT 106]